MQASPRPRLVALVPAAGRGERFGGEVPKQFARIAGRPSLAWTLERLLACGVDRLVVALPADPAATEGLVLPEDTRLVVTSGGATRQESVAACLAAAPGDASDLILVHDGARPAVAVEDVAATVAAALASGAAVLGRPVGDTLKRAGEGRVLETVERAGLFRAETPQVFRRELFERALEAARRDGFVGTDEASLVERLGGVEIRAVAAGSPNPKLTEPGDLEVLAGLLGYRSGAMDLRIGQGYDVHRLVEGRRLVLGGEEIPFERGLEGHSDADVLLHALGDALLGAAGQGDLGEHFPPGDPRWKDAASTDLLARILERVRGAGWRVVNCDLTLLAERPKLAPHRDAIRARIAELLGIDPSAVGLKATTHEKLGALGRGEGIAAQAVVLLARD